LRAFTFLASVAAEVDGGRAGPDIAREAGIKGVANGAELGRSAGIATATAVLGAAVLEDGTKDRLEVSGGGRVSDGGANPTVSEVEMEAMGAIIEVEAVVAMRARTKRESSAGRETCAGKEETVGAERADSSKIEVGAVGAQELASGVSMDGVDTALLLLGTWDLRM
jgi:hypothetical protein